MTSTDHLRKQDLADQFGRSVAARLSAGTSALPYEARERLRAARVRALQARKIPAVAPVIVRNGGGSAALALGDGRPGLFTRIASVLPLVVLAAGLVAIHSVQSDQRASELAEVDAALLTDDLPPAAYADPGFVQFLKQSGRE
ncbi:MAG TPA: DUF3619 family protein [Ramlibacter sp.]|uniref:DUF3619 family protein n=1 Tax=Ramlibacter sp. TaxID=1917967 RepID=UPI002ED34AD4